MFGYRAKNDGLPSTVRPPRKKERIQGQYSREKGERQMRQNSFNILDSTHKACNIPPVNLVDFAETRFISTEIKDWRESNV